MNMATKKRRDASGGPGNYQPVVGDESESESPDFEGDRQQGQGIELVEGDRAEEEHDERTQLIARGEHEHAATSAPDAAAAAGPAAQIDVSVRLPARWLAVVVICLTSLSYLILWSQCAASTVFHHPAATSTYRVARSSVLVRAGKSLKSNEIRRLKADTVVEVAARATVKNNKRVHIVWPVDGWATARKGEDPRAYLVRLRSEHLWSKKDYCKVQVWEKSQSKSNPGGMRWASSWAGPSLVAAQQLWNGSQVFYLLLVVCLWGSRQPSLGDGRTVLPSSRSAGGTRRVSEVILQHRNFLFAFAVAPTIFILPFAVYQVSPGGHVSAALNMAVAIAAVVKAPVVRLQITCCPRRTEENTVTDTDTEHLRVLCKYELLSFACNLGSSMYNFIAESKQNILPRWLDIFDGISRSFNLKMSAPDYIGTLYGFGVKRSVVPTFVPRASNRHVLGSFQFALWWTILPFIYSAYFFSMGLIAWAYTKRELNARTDSRAARWRAAACGGVQLLLVLHGILHFLFFTDCVDYKYGRGLALENAELYHLNEKIAWRVAILLPLFQKVFVTREWLADGGLRGRAVHYAAGLWGVFFFYQLVTNAAPRVDDAHGEQQLLRTAAAGGVQLVTSATPFLNSQGTANYLHLFGYHGALTTMWLFYALCMCYMPCKRFSLAISKKRQSRHTW